MEILIQLIFRLQVNCDFSSNEITTQIMYVRRNFLLNVFCHIEKTKCEIINNFILSFNLYFNSKIAIRNIFFHSNVSISFCNNKWLRNCCTLVLASIDDVFITWNIVVSLILSCKSEITISIVCISPMEAYCWWVTCKTDTRIICERDGIMGSVKCEREGINLIYLIRIFG